MTIQQKIIKSKKEDCPVTLVNRSPFTSSKSIEYIFGTIYHALEQKAFPIQSVTLPYQSNTIKNRVMNILSLLKMKNSVVHVTGDVHYVLLGLFRTKTILTIHDLDFLTRTSGLTRRIYKLLWLTLPVKIAKSITTVSETTKQDILNEITCDQSKINVVYNFVDEIFQPVHHSFNQKCPTILCIGTKHNKNLERVIVATREIQCKLIIIGPMRDSILNLLFKYKTQYEHYENISLTELYEFYKYSDLLCFVSTKEGFGMPIIEAQCSGLPVLTSSTSCLPEIAGDGAVFVDPYNVTSIENGIREIMKDSNLREQIITRGLHNAKRFHLEKSISGYKTIYSAFC